MTCTKVFLPFSNLDNKDLILTVKGEKMKFTNVAEKRISKKPKLFDQIKRITTCEDNDITEYFQSNELRNLLQPSCVKKEYLKAFHLNISPSPNYCSELHSLLSNCRITFDITGITESRLKHNQKAVQNIGIPNCNIKHCPTEGPNGGALIYVKNDIIYKVRNDLKIYQSEKLESVFIERIKSINRNFIIGCVYCHPSMEVNEFNSLFQAFFQVFLSTAIFSKILSFVNVLFAKSVNLGLQIPGKCIFDTLFDFKEYVAYC